MEPNKKNLKSSAAVGYDPNFIDGITLDLPAVANFDHKLQQNTLQYIDERNGGLTRHYLDYEGGHFSLCMSKDPERRSAIVVGVNTRHDWKTGIKGNTSWKEDPRIPSHCQLRNEYYAGTYNAWDRGHLAMRLTVTWGDTLEEATRASESTYVYTNAALQLDGFNRDEWKNLEEWVNTKAKEAGRVTQFTGPIYGHLDAALFIRPEKADTAVRVPSAFFKIVCYRENNELQVRAFIIPQSFSTMSVDFEGEACDVYQSTVKEIEDLTGIKFDSEIARRNPLSASHGGRASPERKVFSSAEDIVSDTIEKRGELLSSKTHLDSCKIMIASAMPNPSGRDRDGEWVLLTNRGTSDQDMTGWTLKAGKIGHTIPLKGILEANEEMLLEAAVLKSSWFVLNNKGGDILLIDAEGNVAHEVNYTAKEVVSGKAIHFLKNAA